MNLAKTIITSALFVASSHASAGFCTFVDDKTAAVAAALGGGTLIGGTALQLAGITAVAHSSGAAILTGSAGYIGSTLGATAFTAGVAAAPVTIALGGVFLTGASGAVLACHPEVFGKLKNAYTVQKDKLANRFGR